MGFRIVNVTPSPTEDDVLLVEAIGNPRNELGELVRELNPDGTLGEVVEVTAIARGWVSYITNHYDPADYADDVVIGRDGDGNEVRDFGRKPGATPRHLTPAEVGAYARELVAAQFPALVDPPPAASSSAAPAAPAFAFEDPVA